MVFALLYTYQTHIYLYMYICCHRRRPPGPVPSDHANPPPIMCYAILCCALFPFPSGNTSQPTYPDLSMNPSTV